MVGSCRADGRLDCRFKGRTVETVKDDILAALTAILRTLEYEPMKSSKNLSDMIRELVNAWKMLGETDQDGIFDESEVQGEMDDTRPLPEGLD